jgi:hypothetical protein
MLHCPAEKRQKCFTHQCEFMVTAALTANHMPTLTSCNGTLGINMGFSAIPVTLIVQISSERKKALPRNKQVCSLFLQQTVHENISSKNSVLFHNLCHKFVDHSCQMDENTAVLLHFLLTTQTCQFVQVKLKIFLEMSPICHQFHPVFPQLVHVLYMFPYLLELSRMEHAAKNLFHNCKLLLFRNRCIRRLMLAFMITLFAGM